MKPNQNLLILSQIVRVLWCFSRVLYLSCKITSKDRSFYAELSSSVQNYYRLYFEQMIQKQEYSTVWCLPTACQSHMLLWSADLSTGWESQVNKLEQISSDGQQMSVAEGGSHVWCPRAGGSCIVKFNASWAIVEWGFPHWTDRHDWKHYVPATLLAVGNKDVQIIVLLDNRFSTSLTSWEQFKFTQCLCWEKWEKYVDRSSSISLHILFVWKICALANVLKYVH